MSPGPQGRVTHVVIEALRGADTKGDIAPGDHDAKCMLEAALRGDLLIANRAVDPGADQGHVPARPRRGRARLIRGCPAGQVGREGSVRHERGHRNARHERIADPHPQNRIGEFEVRRVGG